MVSTAEIIAIVEICVYIPIFFCTLFVVYRHGLRRQLGWIYLAVFCIVRLVGSGFKIASEKNPNSTTDAEWAAILQSVGLSPLIMASMGLLKRITDEVSNHIRSSPATLHNNAMSSVMGRSGIANKYFSKTTADSRRSRTIQLAQLPTTIALILCVIGGINQASSTLSDQKEGRHETKIGVVLFLVIFVFLFALIVVTMKDFRKAPQSEKRIYAVVVMALPLLAIRMLWSLLAAFADDSTFAITGKPLVQLFMAIIEEFLIVVMYTWAGLTTMD